MNVETTPITEDADCCVETFEIVIAAQGGTQAVKVTQVPVPLEALLALDNRVYNEQFQYRAAGAVLNRGSLLDAGAIVLISKEDDNGTNGS